VLGLVVVVVVVVVVVARARCLIGSADEAPV
jgi:hypothetical protein